MFPRGGIELVDFFMDQCREELTRKMLASADIVRE
jgi:hypothetical protein